MALKSLIRYYASDAYDALDNIKDLLVSAGWTLWDDLSASSPYAYVLKSSGENDDEMPFYLHLYINQSYDYLYMIGWAGWNNSTHVGTLGLGSTSFAYIAVDRDGSFYMWASATKEQAAIIVSFGNYYAQYCGVAQPFQDGPAGIIQSGISSGSDVVVQLDTGEAAGFKVGKTYQMIDSSKRQDMVVSAVNTGSDQITISTVSYTFDAGARIGIMPYPWYVVQAQNKFVWVLRMGTNGTASETSTIGSLFDVFSYPYADPDNRTGKYLLWPVIFYDANNAGHFGIMKNDSIIKRGAISTTSEHTMSVGDIDSGTSSGSNTSTTLNDSTKSWTTDEHAGKVLVITGGTGAGQFLTISANAAGQLTISEAFETTPDGTSTYTICEQGWIYFYLNGSLYNSSAMRVI